MRERLSDYSAKDSKNWDTKRSLTQTVEQIFYESEEPNLNKQAKRLRECSSLLLYSLKEDNSIKLKRASFCKVRSCPVCGWRRSKMWQARMFEALPSFSDFRWLLLTLTVKNCEITELKETIKKMQQSFVKMRKRKAFSNVVVGYIKALEVTRSEDGKAHPHFHIMLLVRPSYFSGQGYITKQSWAAEWQSVLNVDYEPVCDIRAITDKKGKGIGGAVLEVLKYETKSADLVKHPDFLQQLALQLKGTRAIELGGLIKDKLKAAGNEEETDEMLITENTDKAELKEVSELVFSWQRFNRFYKLLRNVGDDSGNDDSNAEHPF
jgi:plasmid rolling circle replication initiator protein Rep